MSDLIERDKAKMAVRLGVLSAATIYGRTDEGMTARKEIERAIDELPSAQPESAVDAEFWRKRADYYSDMCFKLIAEMESGVKIEAVKIDGTGITFTKKKPSAQPDLQPTCNKVATDCISRQDAITSFRLDDDGKAWSMEDIIYRIEQFPSAQPDKDALEDAYAHGYTAAESEFRKRMDAQSEPQWNRMMMYLADLQLTYSPNWGANGQGDKKLYDFVTGLIEELEGWTEPWRGEEHGRMDV